MELYSKTTKAPDAVAKATTPLVWVAKCNAWVYAGYSFATVLIDKNAIDEIKKIGGKIGDAVTAQTNLQVQVGCHEGSSFADHVYTFLLSRIKQYSSVEGRHFFFIYHPGTDWIPRFEKLVEDNQNIVQEKRNGDPLPPDTLLGIGDNLDKLGG